MPHLTALDLSANLLQKIPKELCLATQLRCNGWQIHERLVHNCVPLCIVRLLLKGLGRYTCSPDCCVMHRVLDLSYNIFRVAMSGGQTMNLLQAADILTPAHRLEVYLAMMPEFFICNALVSLMKHTTCNQTRTMCAGNKGFCMRLPCPGTALLRCAMLLGGAVTHWLFFSACSMRCAVAVGDWAAPGRTAARGVWHCTTAFCCRVVSGSWRQPSCPDRCCKAAAAFQQRL